VVGAALAGGFWWARTHPSACPYSQRWMLDFPRPGLSPSRLQEVLEARAGERVLELGPGTGMFTLPVAEALEPGGRLDVLDLQQEMLDHLAREAESRGIRNIEPAQGDATELPYPDATFDGAFLVTVLGEVPDQDAALRELRRVLKPGARLVFGETPLDPHVVTLSALRRRGEAAGFRFERRSGGPLGWCARFTAV
jgi:ubiquinone/menaquinone biosynthesis C-methylase UbiE